VYNIHTYTPSEKKIEYVLVSEVVTWTKEVGLTWYMYLYRVSHLGEEVVDDALDRQGRLVGRY